MFSGDRQGQLRGGSMSIGVLIVEDEPEFLNRFSEAVLSDKSLHLLGAVASGSEAIALLNESAPDVMLVDLGLPDTDGVEVIRHTAARHPNTDILVVTMFGDDEHVLASIEAGATGYLLKDTSIERIVAGIREIRSGGSPISPTIARRVLTRFRAAPSPAATTLRGSGAPLTDSTPLSARETDILRLVSKGLSCAEVGEHLSISSHTVVTHVKNIYRKLAVHSRGEAIFEAGQLGLL
jgi:DNA-binding NarL/FixJ family response regulator